MSRTKKNNDSRVGVWMDHQNAHVVTRDDKGEFVSELIEAKIQRDEHTAKSRPANESHKHGRQSEDLKKFYRLIQKKLQSFDHILLTGPTTASAEFHHFLMNISSFSGKRIAEEKSGKMTKRQMLAWMKKKLGKPMDIFRPEEVV